MRSTEISVRKYQFCSKIIFLLTLVSMEGHSITKVVLLACGSFNPITNMHMRMFELARDHLEDTAEQNIDDVDTIKYAKKRRIEENHHDLQLMLLCGADVLESFGIPNMWKQEDIAEIVGRHGLVCISRSNSDPHKFIHQSDLLWKYRKNIHIVREWVTNDISATHVRRSLRRGQSVRYLLPDSVIHYIKEHGLYSSESEQKNADVVLAPLQRYTGASSS
uniref:Nicotinamide/nicotinic acid mononucleotide adenylyltransferase 3 n=1 Tax=Neolamprologus brichardi TaxID=32507 RepID=A0A3Q4MFS0_NEOBR